MKKKRTSRKERRAELEKAELGCLVINGEHIYDKMPGKPGWYKTADMARIFIGEHVENVVFK